MRSARRLLALSVLLASTPCAAADLELFSAETLSLSGNVRLSATSGEESWVDGGVLSALDLVSMLALWAD